MDLLKKLYAVPSVYRLVWTSVTVGAATLAGLTFDSPQLALAVGIVVQVATSEAREHLAEKKA